ncbi:hypothetical protein L1887_54449 [Cichorium endivia]|nr:hypothetical protein L1887_54449 [Cichorium endivia]
MLSHAKDGKWGRTRVLGVEPGRGETNTGLKAASCIACRPPPQPHERAAALPLSESVDAPLSPAKSSTVDITTSPSND